MDFKKKCIKIKQEAKKLGYEIKLTHVQEIIARADGFASRHSKIKEENNQIAIPLPGNPGKGKSFQSPQFYHYDVHVFYSMDDGYSTFIRSEKELMDFEAINLAYELGFLEEDDMKQVSYVEEMLETDYLEAIGDRSENVCSSCSNHYPDNEGSKKEGSFTCSTCQRTEGHKQEASVFVKKYLKDNPGDFKAANLITPDGLTEEKWQEYIQEALKKSQK